MCVIVEPTFLSNCSHGGVGFGQKPAGAFDADLEEVLMGGGSEKFVKGAFQLAQGEAALAREVFRLEGLSRILVQVVYRGRNPAQRIRLAAELFHPAGEARDPDHTSRGVPERNLVGHHQVWRSLGFRRRLHSVQDGNAGIEHLAVVLDILPGSAFWEEIEVGFSDRLPLGGDSAVIAAAAVEGLETALGVFDEERDVRQDAQERDQLFEVGDLMKKRAGFRHCRHAVFLHKTDGSLQAAGPMPGHAGPMNGLRIFFAAVLPAGAAFAGTVDFARDVQPILSANCYACHGPDESHRKAGLRLDVEAEAKRPYEDGVPVKPGDPAGSTALARILSQDPDEVMPPPKAHRVVTVEQREILSRWIAEGAPWGVHWAFEPVRRPEGTLDDQVRTGLVSKGLRMQPRASGEKLVRRLALDLTGLPPGADMVALAEGGLSESEYGGLVERLLGAPEFGEHWARMWLDLARYADTKGYEKDLGRTIWPYRDWVVGALNADMRLDQFTREQLAGDLLPEATESQIIATAFHRNTMTNDEGGTDDEEFRVAAVKDRVDTTLQVWMGLTMGCAKCHSHKYDPISIHDYYAVYAVFNQTEDADRGDDAPRLSKPTPDQSAASAAAATKVEEARTALARVSGRDPKSRGFEAADPDDPAEVSEWKKRLSAAREEQRRADAEILAIPVMRELPVAKHRKTRVHQRGNFLEPGAAVEPGVLAGFGPKPDGAVDRLKFADWLVSPANPLTPRVWANRVWARLFGTGIVETEEDFGAQGAAPSNRALLDWLAAEYRDGGWSLKHLLKTVVLSEAYRQESAVDKTVRNADPGNQLGSRGGRHRLSAEVIRDQALAVSGLLSSKRGGPSVMPPQPSGLWRSAYSGRQWVDAEGEDRYRRGLYTYLKRTTPYPSFLTFDAGSGEVCQIRRIRTNTPLQALVTLNDPVYLEAAGALGQWMRGQGENAGECVRRGMERALSRRVSMEEARPLIALYKDALEEMRRSPEQAAALLRTCRVQPESGKTASSAGGLGSGAAELAAAAVVANAVLNLDEFLTHP